MPTREVNTTNERIKKLRKTLDLTQQEFADRLNIKRNTVATYETGKSNPSDAAVTLICREFKVREAWLRTGEGEMFQEMSRDDEIAVFFDAVLRDESDAFRKRFISMLSRLDSEDWDDLEHLAVKLLEDRAGTEAPSPLRRVPPEKIVPPGYSSREELEAEADAFAAMAREQYLSEKLPESRAYYAPESDGSA